MLKICTYFCTEVEEILDTLHILAKIAIWPDIEMECPGEFLESTLSENKVVTVQYCSKLIAAVDARDAEDLKDVIEILYHLVEFEVIIKVLPQLLLKVKLHRNDEELMTGVVTLLALMQEDWDTKQKDEMMKNGAVYTVSVLAGLLYASNPFSMGLGTAVNFPKDTTFAVKPFPIMLLDAVHSLTFEHKDFTNSTKIIRQIIPILSFVLQNISELYKELMESFTNSDFVCKCVDLELLLIERSGKNTKEKDFRLLISSKFMQRLLTLFEKSTPETCCQEDCCREDCYLIRGIVNYFQEIDKCLAWKSFPKEDLI